MGVKKIKHLFQMNKAAFNTCIVLFLLNILLYFGGIGYLRNKIFHMQDAYSQIRQRSDDISSDNQAGIRLIQRELTAFYEQLLPLSDMLKVVGDLKERIEKPGVVVSKMTFKPQKIEDRPLWKYTTFFTLGGSYEVLKQILADIQQSPQLYCIDRLSFYNDSDKDERIELSLSITTYYTGE